MGSKGWCCGGLWLLGHTILANVDLGFVLIFVFLVCLRCDFGCLIG